MSQVEYVTEQFYAWETRGRGWQLWEEPVELEPPFRPFFIPPPPVARSTRDDGRRPTLLSGLADRLGGAVRGDPSAQAVESPPYCVEEPEPRAWQGHQEIAELLVAVPHDLEVSREAAEQFLLAIPATAGPVAFELLGTGESIRLLLACAPEDEPTVAQALKGYFPGVLVSREPAALRSAWESPERGQALVADFGLAHEFMVPLRVQRSFEVDPLAGMVAALADLQEGEVGVLQLLFKRVRHPWSREVLRAVLDDRGSPFFIDAPEVSALAKAKVSRPLFACVLRVGVRSATRARSLAVARRLAGAFGVLADPLANELIPLQDPDEYSPGDHEADLLQRRSRRSGAILSVGELASLAHLPTSGVQEARLVRHAVRSKAAPTIAAGAGVSLGQNTHDGRTVEVRLSAEQRLRHAYVIGASGTGKSTLLLNLIRQDLEKGEGLAVFDPHGDLVDRVLGFVPEHRLEDVILLDPADVEFPVGFNILSAASELEQTLLASDLVALFQRLSMSWGDQMTSVLGNAILAFLENDQGGTLIDLRRFLVEERFRKEVLSTVRDPDVVYFWEREFTLLRGKPQAPILTRLDTFLRPKSIRYMVAQKDSRLDLRRVMDEGKVLLCRLSHGAIGEENAHLLGTLLVSKLQQVVMSRQDVAEERRRPFYVYIDEFHHFVTPSMAAILSGARKYRLGLVLAHQDLQQLQSRSADVFSAVIANPCVRVCFRLGDEDARLLAKGFASFDGTDLQNLGVGEAIARIERADFDFNLKTPRLSPADGEEAEARRERIVANTRRQFARPRAEIATLLGLAHAGPEEPIETVAHATPVSIPRQPAAAPPTPVPTEMEARAPLPVDIPTPPSTPGRGGPQHKYLQELIRRWGEANGWGATVEERVLDGLGSVDVALRRGEVAVACEIVVSSPAEHEFQNIQKCLMAGFTWVVTVSPEKRRLGHVRALAKEHLTPEQLDKLHFASAEEVLAVLAGLGQEGLESESTVRGYKVKVRIKSEKPEEKEERRSAVSAVIAKAMRRLVKAREQHGRSRE